ncbi:MAG: hypothetical protein CFE23_16680 [Flavobacterium sp. BFFFF1]|uniref:hypothetical protein n=1 Tax=Flavobacterium sp. BFFFF1 TaxID=2015557 RepID=UPI000BC77127|nr:hypothetical protein [Flavobacterium sp. BFFFF1]OYU78852.1 MAG: hypothetical protein CFE23_16680 [Flavobacterium sp. BFFFF1]
MSEDIFNPETEFKKFHSDKREDYNFEIRQKRPSEYFLKRFAEKISSVVDKWQSMNTYSMSEVISARYQIDIFLADLDSDLALNKDEKYKAEWEKKYAKLKGIQNEFVKRYKESLDKL